MAHLICPALVHLFTHLFQVCTHTVCIVVVVVFVASDSSKDSIRPIHEADQSESGRRSAVIEKANRECKLILTWSVATREQSGGRKDKERIKRT